MFGPPPGPRSDQEVWHPVSVHVVDACDAITKIPVRLRVGSVEGLEERARGPVEEEGSADERAPRHVVQATDQEVVHAVSIHVAHRSDCASEEKAFGRERRGEAGDEIACGRAEEVHDASVAVALNGLISREDGEVAESVSIQVADGRDPGSEISARLGGRRGKDAEGSRVRTGGIQDVDTPSALDPVHGVAIGGDGKLVGAVSIEVVQSGDVEGEGAAFGRGERFEGGAEERCLRWGGGAEEKRQRGEKEETHGRWGKDVPQASLPRPDEPARRPDFRAKIPPCGPD